MFAFAVISVMLVSGCTAPPAAPSAPTGPSGQEYLDDFGCFPTGCDLPPGMKELCQDFASEKINWPEDCSVFRDEPCRQLCEWDKTRPLDNVTFIVEVPPNTPQEDIDIHLQVEPCHATDYVYYLKRMDRMPDGRWTTDIRLRPGEVRYRFFRNNFGEAAQEELPGDLEGWRMRDFSPGDTVEDTVTAWRWYPHVGEELPSPPPSLAGQKEIAPRVDGIPFQRGYLYYDFWWDSCDRFVTPTDNSMKESNGNWAGIWPAWNYVQKEPLPVIGYEGYGHTHDPDELEYHISTVQADGLNVWLAPQVCCDNPDAGGTYSSEWWEAWFQEMDEFSIFFAEAAEEHGLEYFSMHDEGLFWRNPGIRDIAKERYSEHIEKVREVYTGKLGMPFATGGNYDSPSDIFPSGGDEDVFSPEKFDFFSVAIWTPVTDKLDPTTEELEAGFRRIFEQAIEPLYERWGKPIIITTSYPSVDGGASSNLAWDTEEIQIWSEYSGNYRLDLEEQAMVYEAVMRVVSDYDFVIGFYPFVYGYTDLPKSKEWTIRGKPAEDIVAGWYGSFA
jgi:hypothetical protein